MSVIIRDGVEYVNTSIIITTELRDEARRQGKNFTALVEESARYALGMKPLKNPAQTEGR